MGGARGKGRRLSPLPPLSCVEACGVAPQTLSASCIPNCCAVVPRCTPSSTLRSSAAHRTSSETNSRSSILPATVHENSPRARFASASPAECAPTRSAVPHTTPENAGWSVPVRCRSESPSVARAPPRSHPTLVSLFDWQNWCPLPRPNTPACTHPLRSALGSLVRIPPHRARNPAPTPGSPPSRRSSGCPSRTQCFRFFRRIISPAARYTRCTRLWFTCSPERPSNTCSRRYPKRGFARANSTSRVRSGSSRRLLW